MDVLKKQVSHAFRKDIYLLGEDEHGTRYWLEHAKWDCGWYWGFGYIETYTNNRSPSNSRDIASHEHANDFYPQWWDSTKYGPSRHNPRLVKTTFTNDEGWQLAELFKQFYILRDAAEMFGRGGCNITKADTYAVIKNADAAEHINNTLIPAVCDAIYKILSPETK